MQGTYCFLKIGFWQELLSFRTTSGGVQPISKASQPAVARVVLARLGHGSNVAATASLIGPTSSGPLRPTLEPHPLIPNVEIKDPLIGLGGWPAQAIIPISPTGTISPISALAGRWWRPTP